MFTGIITDIGTVRSAEPRGDLRLMIGCGYDLQAVELDRRDGSLRAGSDVQEADHA